MAGLRGYFNGISGADLVTEFLSTAGALVAALTLPMAWTGVQYSTPKTLALDTGAITVDFTALTNGNAYYYDLASGAAALANPTGLAAGMSWWVVVEADATGELTYGGQYTFGTDTAPDFSAMTNGDQVRLDCYAVSATRIMVTASVVYAA